MDGHGWKRWAITLLPLLALLQGVIAQRCQQENCRNGGYCTEAGNDCVCMRGYQGIYCEQECTKLDLALVIDISSSIGYENWREHVVPFFQTLVRSLPVKNGDVRIGAVLFSTRVGTFYRLNDFTTPEEMVRKFKSIDYYDCPGPICPGERFTNTESGIELGCTMFTRGMGDRVGVKNAMMVVTDGKHNVGKHPKYAAQRCRSSSGAQIIAVGVSHYYLPELRSIADKDPNIPDRFIITTRSFANLKDKLPAVIGTTCDVSVIKVCDSNPCQNGGNCNDYGDRYSCNCRRGYSGTHCERAEPCTSRPCQNGATCVDFESRFRCDCRPGYTGRLCDTKINICGSNPCANGGTCESNTEQWWCYCTPQFSGYRCQIANIVMPCQSQPCLNGATCSNDGDRYVCTCPFGFSGGQCTIDCRTLDVVFVLDISGSVGQENWRNQVVPIVRSLIQKLPIDEGKVLVGAVLYASRSGEFFRFNHFRSRAEVIRTLENLDFIACEYPVCRSERYTHIQGGIDLGCTLFEEYKGGRANVFNAMFVITDGNWNRGNFPGPAADRCRRQKDATIIAVGVADFSPSVLESIASEDPKDQQKLMVTTNNLARLPEVLESVILRACPDPPKVIMCDEMRCQNGGVCFDDRNGALCDCRTGFTGTYCETNIDDCKPNPCMNDGYCEDLVNDFRCICRDGFNGRYCERECDMLDIVFVSDLSGSIGRDTWERQVVPLAQRLIRLLPIDNGKVRVGAILYSSKSNEFFSFYNFTSSAGVIRAFQNLDYMDCKMPACRAERFTHIEGGIEIGCSLFDELKGDRPHVKNAMVLITDGMFNRGNHPRFAAQRCRQRTDVNLWAFGVGEYNRNLLLEVANNGNGDPDRYVVTTDDLHRLPGIVSDMLRRSC